MSIDTAQVGVFCCDCRNHQFIQVPKGKSFFKYKCKYCDYPNVWTKTWTFSRFTPDAMDTKVKLETTEQFFGETPKDVLKKLDNIEAFQCGFIRGCSYILWKIEQQYEIKPKSKNEYTKESSDKVFELIKKVKLRKNKK